MAKEPSNGYLSSSGEACWIRILGLAGRLRGRDLDKDFLCVHIQNMSSIGQSQVAELTCHKVVLTQ